MKDCKLKQPEQYLDSLRKTIKRHKEIHGGLCHYTKNWRLELVRKTNAHRECDGGLWGWWEIWPLGKTVGYWDKDSDDLKGVDVVEWNRVARELAP